MAAVIESDDPAKSVSGAEEQLGRHEQHRVSVQEAECTAFCSHIASNRGYNTQAVHRYTHMSTPCTNGYSKQTHRLTGTHPLCPFF